MKILATGSEIKIPTLETKIHYIKVHLFIIIIWLRNKVYMLPIFYTSCKCTIILYLRYLLSIHYLFVCFNVSTFWNTDFGHGRNIGKEERCGKKAYNAEENSYVYHGGPDELLYDVFRKTMDNRHKVHSHYYLTSKFNFQL